MWIGGAGKFYETFTVPEAVRACDEVLSQVQEETGQSTVCKMIQSLFTVADAHSELCRFHLSLQAIIVAVS